MDTLSTLEKLIVEFYDPYTSNQRRQEIENSLLAYENHPTSWKDCLQYVTNGKNILVSSFCLRVIENVISKHWSKLPFDDKVILQNSLSSYLFDRGNNIPSPISKHLMKLITKIARNEWSAVSCSFISDIVNIILSGDPKMVSLGLSSLLIASEELINSQDNLCTTRKQEIRDNFEMHIPRIFCVLNETFRKYKQSDVEEEIYEILLNVYSQLFSWIPLSDLYSIETLLPIYECAVRGNSKISISALSALNEILYKNCVPSQNIPLIVSICCRLNHILSCVSETQIDAVNDEYLAKIVEMVSLIFSLHWHRIESNMEPAGIMSFLSSFYKLSFNRTSGQSYCTCLEIWCNFLEYLTMRDAHHVKQYENLLTSLLGEIIRKLESEMFVNENVKCPEVASEDSPTVFNQHMNVIDLIIELIPENAFALMFDTWSRSRLIYIQSWTAIGAAKNVPIHANEQEIIAAVHAFCISTQILTSLYSKATGELKTVVAKNLKDVISLGNGECVRRPSYIGGLARHVLNVHCELLKMVPVWIRVQPSQTCRGRDGGNVDDVNKVANNNNENEGGENGDDDGTIREIFSSTLPFVIQSENSFYLPELLQVAAAHLIANLTSHMKRASLLQPLFVDPTFKHLPLEARQSLQCALCCWVCSCKTESHDDRLKFLRSLFELIVSNNLENLKDVCVILRNCGITRSEGKQMLFVALEPWLELVVDKYPVHFSKKSPLCETSILFLLEAFRILQNHFKPTLLQKMLCTFDACLSDASIDHGGNNVPDPSIPVGHDYGFEKMIAFFMLLMESPGHTNNEYISGVICVAQKIFHRMRTNRITATDSSSDGFNLEFHKLLCCILLNKWQYFYKVTRLNGKAELNRSEEFETILGRILESFGESDIATYRSNLHAIEEMNTKWNLYDRELFRVKYLPVVLNTLLTTLVEGCHKLLTDEILSATYHMAAVNFEVFYNVYLPLFLKSVPGLTEQRISGLRSNLNPQTDMPTFFQIIGQLINDIRSYRMESGFT